MAAEDARERVRKYNARYYAEHKHEQRAGREAWDTAHREQKLAATRAWWRAHPEYKAAWRAAHPEGDRAYAVANRARKAEAGRAYATANRARKAETSRAYAKANPAKRIVAEQKRRARKLHSPGGGISHDQWLTLQGEYGGRCAYCAAACELTMDHIAPLSKGGAHTVENVAPACRSCNSSKSNKSLIVWLASRAARRV